MTPYLPSTLKESTVPKGDVITERTHRGTEQSKDVNTAEADSQKRLEPVLRALHRGGLPLQASQRNNKKKNRPRKSRKKPLTKGSQTKALKPADFRVASVGRTEIVLIAGNTGQEFRYSSEDASMLQTAWRAFAEGAKVKPTVQNGQLTRLELEQIDPLPTEPQ